MDRIDLSVHMDDVLVIKAAHHVGDGVHFSDMREKLVAKPLSLACALDQSCDIHKLDDGRNHFLALIHLFKHAESFVRNRHHADVWINGAERVISRLRSGFCQCVKDGALPHVWKSHNSYFHKHLVFLISVRMGKPFLGGPNEDTSSSLYT